MAGQFLKAAAESPEGILDLMRLTARQIQVAMFATGSKNLSELHKIKLKSTERG
jgi:isopentenyl diphosphate isomerase/L-lactate dehydrogenase-like FMN-dependent dehydrogenase